MKTVTESDISEAQANMQFVQALAAAGGDFRSVNMPDEDLAKVTEVVFPDGVRLNGDVNSDYNLQNYPFTRMPRLRKLVIRDPDTLLPNGYFCHMNSPEAEVELPYSAMKPSMFASAKLRLVKLTATSRFGSRLRDVSLHHSFYHCEAGRVELPEGL